MRDAAVVDETRATRWRLLDPGMLCALASDAFIAPYAAFTVAINAAVLLGAPAGIGLTCAGLAVLGASLLLVGLLARRPSFLRAYLDDIADEPASAQVQAPRSTALLLALAPAIAIATWLLTRSPWLVWGEALLAFALASWLALSTAREPLIAAGASARPALTRSVWLFALSLACAAFALSVVRPRTDDAFYLNMAVAAVDFPQLRLLSLNTLHGLPEGSGLPVQHMFPPYRVHSFELLGAFFARLLGLDVTSVIHLGFTCVFAMLVPFVVARLLRLLAPRYWLGALLIALAFYLLEGTASRGYSNQAFVRLFNGKSVMLTLAVPLLCVHGLRFGARPTRLRFAWLAAAQIAAVGLSSTGLWLAPTLAVISTVAAAPRGKLVSRALWSALSASYVLALGLWVAVQMMSSAAPSAESTVGDDAVMERASEPVQSQRDADAHETAARAVPASLSAEPPGRASALETVERALPDVLGPEVTVLGLLAVFAWAAFFARSALTLRLLSLLGLALCALFANPALALLIERGVTGRFNYERVFWLLPIPIAAALLATYGYERLRARLSPALSSFLIACSAATFFLVVSRQPVFTAANRATLQVPPVIKLWPHAVELARAVCKHAPTGSHVLAPLIVSHVLPTIHRCGHPLIADSRWLNASPAEREERARLVRAVGSPIDLPVAQIGWFVAAVARHHVTSIVLLRDAVRGVNVKSALRWAGFEKTRTIAFSQLYAPERRASLWLADLTAQLACRHAPPEMTVLAPFTVMERVARSRCAQPLLAGRPSGKPLTAAEQDAIELERLVFTNHDIEPERIAWLRATVRARALGTIVLGPGARANKVLGNELRRLGFVSMGGVGNYRVLLKREPDAPDP